MTRTVTALFDDYDDAVEAVRRLKQAGIPDAQISLVSGSEKHRSSGTSDRDDNGVSDAGKGAAIGSAIGGGAGLLAGLGMLAIPGLGPVVAAGWLASTLAGLAAGATTGGLIGALVDTGLSESEAHAYAEGIRRGGTLVSTRVEESLVETAVGILDDEGTVNMGERETQWRGEGWSGRFGQASSSQLGEGSNPPRAQAQQGTIPVIEEELNVGKRAVERGRVRVHSHVVERPVEEQVTLRDERVSVDRRAVDKPVSSDTPLQDQVVEAHVVGEEPVVEKRARIKEEVGLRQDVDQRTETIRDKVRHTEVDVDDDREHQTPGPRVRRGS
jgi:uncharacterized protein (TIGR02271 family)